MVASKQTRKHFRNAVSLVSGSLRLTPIITCPSVNISLISFFLKVVLTGSQFEEDSTSLFPVQNVFY